MRVGSLFAGIGGFDLAAERVGMEVAWQSELDPHASRVLAHHWPDVPNLGDIHDITEPPTVDVLTGGFPCQDYSVAGRGAGLAGDRGALWWQMHRIIAECRPTWVVGENVFGLTTRRHQDPLRTIIGSLVDLGYGVVWRVLDAQWFGVAQRRRRVFIVGHSGGQPRPEVLALAQSVCGDSPPSRETREGVAAAVAGRPDLSSEVSGSLGSLTGGVRTTDLDQMGAYVTSTVGPLTTHVPGDRGTEGIESAHVLAVQGTSVGRSEDAGPRGPSYLDDGSMFTVRRLTPLECERLQGFPDHWTAIPGNPDSQRYKQLGNAVAVPVAEWILGNIAKAAP